MLEAIRGSGRVTADVLYELYLEAYEDQRLAENVRNAFLAEALRKGLDPDEI